MTGTLAPEGNFNVAVESPIAPVDYSGLAGLVGTVLKEATDTSVNEGALDQSLVRGLKKIRALHDQGKHREAYTLESNVLANYSQLGGNLGSTRIKTLVQGITGRDPEDFGNSPEEVAVQETLKSEVYQGAYLGTFATNPDASPEERQQLALGHLSLKEGRAAILEQAQFQWSAEGEAAYMGEINDFENMLFGSVTMSAQQSGSLSLAEAQQANLAFQNFRRQVESQRPANVSNEDWGKITKRLDQTQEMITYFEGLMGPDNVASVAVSNLQQAIKASKVPSVQKNLMLNLINSDPAMLAELGVVPVSEMKQILESLQIPENGEITSGQLRDATITDPFPTADPDLESSQVYGNLMGATKGASLAKNLTTNDGAREAWGKSVTVGLSNLNELAARGEWMTNEQYANVFSPEFFSQLEAIKAVDPTLHEALSSRAQRALTTTGFALQERLDSVGANSPLEFDAQTQEFMLTQKGLNRIVPPHEAKRITEAAIAAYGGDADTALTLALRDNGSLFNGQLVNRTWFNVQGVANHNRKEMEQLTGSMFEVLAAQRQLTTGSPSDLDPQSVKTDVNRPLPQAVANDVEFMESVVGVGSRLNVDPNHLLRAIDFETAGTFDPSIEHAGSSAVGLIGFLRATAKDLGYTTEQLKKMSRAEQMSVVEQYLTPKLAGVENPTFGDVYLAIHYPAAIGKGDDFVIYSKGSAEYKANKSLDSNKDGSVTAGEAVARAWGGSSTAATVPSAIGEAIIAAREAGSESVSDTDFNTSAPLVSGRPPERPSEDLSQPRVDPSLQPTGRKDGKRSASEVAVQNMKEKLIAEFPNLSDEELNKSSRPSPKYNLSSKSLRRLEGVHPDLIRVVQRAIELTDQDFSVNAGVRTASQQNALYQKGRIKPGNIVTYRDGYNKKSNHQAKSDGYGHSVDLIPYPVDWNDWSKFETIRDAMFAAGEELGVSLTWGGDWKTLRDGPHFELNG